MRTHKGIVLWAIALIVMGIVLGAFGAHGLKGRLSVDQLNSFEAGVRYQLYNALGLIVLHVLAIHAKFNELRPAQFILSGIILFSGSIYGLVFLKMVELPYKMLGPITPIGGLLLIIGWAWVFVKLKKATS